MGESTVRALDGVSIAVEQGEFLGLLGPSGSGKSTLLNLIAGLDRATEGSLRVFGDDLAQMSSDALSRHRQRNVGIIFQSFMSILERTREIGIMKAIGGSDGDIRRIFLVEASVIGCMGGVAGVALGWLVGRVINFGANVYIQSQGGPTGNLFTLPLWLVAGAIGFAFVVSLIAGSYPASRAARLDPIQALRHD